MRVFRLIQEATLLHEKAVETPPKTVLCVRLVLHIQQATLCKQMAIMIYCQHQDVCDLKCGIKCSQGQDFQFSTDERMLNLPVTLLLSRSTKTPAVNWFHAEL